MSKKQLARRVGLQLNFENMEVTEDINLHLLSAIYTDEEEDKADDFQIEYEDREGNLLGDWVEETKMEEGEIINYVVQRGDTLWDLAEKYLGSGMKYSQIAQENNIPNPDLIYPGQVFKITKSKESLDSSTKEQGSKTKENGPKLVTAVFTQMNWRDTGENLTLDIGTFEIDSVVFSGPPDKMTVKSTSIPYSSTLRMEKKSKAWEKYTLKGIGEEIAKKNGLQLMYEAPDNPSYERKEQVQISDIKFLQMLCHAEGMALKVTALTIIIYDTAEYDKKPAIMTFEKGNSDILNYRMETNLTDTAYTSCHVSYSDPKSKKMIEYTFTPDANSGTGQILEVNEKVTNMAEAIRLAKKRLREKNQNEYQVKLTVIGDVTLVAGVTINLKGFQQFDRKYRVVQAKHNLLNGYTVDLLLKQVLEGY